MENQFSTRPIFSGSVEGNTTKNSNRCVIIRYNPFRKSKEAERLIPLGTNQLKEKRA